MSRHITLLALVALVGCAEEEQGLPVLEGVEPGEATVGDQVQLLGSDLDGAQVQLTGVLDEVLVDVTEHVTGGGSGLTLQVPLDLEPKVYAVHVEREGFRTECLSLKVAAAPEPEITSVNPGLAEVGDTVVLEGEDFGEAPGRVIFRPLLEAEVSEWSNERIEAVVPEGTLTGGIRVESWRGGVSRDFRFAVGDPSNRSLSFVQEVVFSQSCARVQCHGQANASELSLRPGKAWENLVGVPAKADGELVRVVPGSPETSFLVEKISSSDPAFGERMPKEGAALSDAEIELVVNWIAAGALDD